MIVFDTIIMGFYILLEQTIYRNSAKIGFGAKDHSMLLSSFLYSLNLYVIFSLFWNNFFVLQFNFNLFIIITIGIFISNYFFYLKRKRIDKLIASNWSTKRKTISVFLIILYSILTTYLFLNVN